MSMLGLTERSLTRLSYLMSHLVAWPDLSGRIALEMLVGMTDDDPLKELVSTMHRYVYWCATREDLRAVAKALKTVKERHVALLGWFLDGALDIAVKKGT